MTEIQNETGDYLRRLLICGLREVPKRLSLNSQYKIHLVTNVIEMRNAFLLPDVAGVVIYIEKLTEKSWKNLSQLAHKYPLKHFILCGEHIEKTVKTKIDEARNCHFLWPHEEPQINLKLKQILENQTGITRRSDRKRINAPVIVKASEVMVESPTGQRMKAMLEGIFIDFSKHGAKFFLPEGLLKAKEYICIMYQQSGGQWVSMESQIRWTEKDPLTGKFLVGVQFIARVS